MPRRPRKNATMDQFLTKPAARDGCGGDAHSAAAEQGVAAAEQVGGTPHKKRARTSAAPRTLAPQRRLLQDDDGAAAPVVQPLSTDGATSLRDDGSSPVTVPAAVAKKEPPPPLTEEQERVLKDFDLRSRFGAAAGVDRLVRWERAYRLGLKPPDVVKEILQEYAEVPEVRRCVLDAHLLRYDPGGDCGIRC